MSDQAAYFEFLCRMGDNTLVLGHRVSEWCGHAPVLEEDIALANTALDLIGQTQMWLGLAGEVEGANRSADDLAMLRDAWDFRNCLLVEQPNGDFGQTMMRQFLFDSWHLAMLGELQNSSEPRVAEIAAQVGLADQLPRKAGELSHGQKQWLEIGMLLAQEPKLLLVDEPAAGMTLAEREATTALLVDLARTRAVVVVEHDMEFVRRLNCRVTVLHEGSVLAEGSLDHVTADQKVIEVYLGR